MKRVLSILFSVIAFNSYGQMGLGIEAGLNASDYTVKVFGNPKKTEFRFGGRIGVLSDMALTDNFYFQPGLFYVTNGYRTNFPKGYEKYTLHTIEVPLNIQYKIGILGTNRFFVGVGPFIGFSRTGTYYVTAAPVESTRGIRFGNEVTDDIRFFDLGAGVNLGYQFTEGLFIRGRAQMGLLDVMPEGIPNSSARSMGFSLSVGYLFYKRDKEGRIKINRDRSKKQKDK